MRKWKMYLAAGMIILLTGCTQQVEREPISIKDEKAELYPANTALPQVQPTEQETAEKTEGIKEQLAGITSLKEAPEELTVREIVDGRAVEKKLILQKCDGGYGFYLPEHEDSKLAWNLEEESEEQFIFGNLGTIYNESGMHISMICYEKSTLDYARELVSGVDTIADNSDNNYIINVQVEESEAEECTVGIKNYPAVRTPKLTIPANYILPAEGDVYDKEAVMQGQGETNGEMDESSRVQMTVQYYFIEIPEGLLRITFNAPSEGGEASWADTEQILESMIIEDRDTYQDYHSAVSVNARERELKFKNLTYLYNFYNICLVRGDYESAMKVSKNIETVENGKEVWERMECYPSGPIEFLEQNNRVAIPCLLLINEADNTSLPEYQESEQELLRYMYFVKEGDYWYLDGPLHNEEPAEAWWQGEITSWDVQDYGLSDSDETGVTISSQEQTTEIMNSWGEKVSR